MAQRIPWDQGFPAVTPEVAQRPRQNWLFGYLSAPLYRSKLEAYREVYALSAFSRPLHRPQLALYSRS